MSGTRVPSSPGPQYDQKWMYWFWDWVRANRAGYVGSGVRFSGDVTGTLASGTTSLTLSTTGVAAGTYGGATVIPSYVVDAKGRLTSSTNAGTLSTSAYSLNLYSIATGGTVTIGSGQELLFNAGFTANGAVSNNQGRFSIL